MATNLQPNQLTPEQIKQLSGAAGYDLTSAMNDPSRRIEIQAAAKKLLASKSASAQKPASDPAAAPAAAPSAAPASASAAPYSMISKVSAAPRGSVARANLASKPAEASPKVPVAGSDVDSMGVVDAASKDAVKLPMVVAVDKTNELLASQYEFNRNTLANLNESTAPILSRNRELYQRMDNLHGQINKNYQDAFAKLKDLERDANQEADIAKGGQMQAMRAQLAAKGITGEAAEAAVAQATYDPKYVKMANDIKKSYLKDLTALSDQMQSAISSVTKDQAGLNQYEAQVLEQIRAQKEELDQAINAIKQTGTKEKFEPLEKYSKGKAEKAVENAVKDFDVRQDIAIWQKNDVNARMSSIQNMLYSSGGDDARGYFNEAELRIAAAKATPAEAKQYLMNIMQARQGAAATALASASAGSPSSSAPSAATPSQNQNPEGSMLSQLKVTLPNRALSGEQWNQFKARVDGLKDKVSASEYNAMVSYLESKRPARKPAESGKAPSAPIDDEKKMAEAVKSDQQNRIEKTRKAKEIANPVQQAQLMALAAMLNADKISSSQYDSFVDSILNKGK